MFLSIKRKIVFLVEFTLEIDEKEVSPETIRQLVEVAGNKIGLCDFRPTRRGPFGRFEIAEWKVNRHK